MNHRIESMKPSASMVLMARAKEMQKTDPTVIGLAGGEPDFPTPDRISMAAIRSLTEGYTHYVVGPGLPELRQAIQKKLREENGLDYDVNCIMVTPGGKNAIYLAVQAILNEGDEVMVLDPAWVSYEPIIQAAGGVTVKVKLDYQQDYRITAEALEAVCTDKTRLIIINYPNNPTGRLLPLPLLEWILQGCAVWGARVFLDECFLDLTEDGVSAKALLAAHPELLILKAFTKSYGMAGIRLGYCLCADSALLHRMASASQPWNVSSLAQSAGVAALTEQDFLQRTRSLVHTERRWLTDNLTALGFWVCPSHANYLLFRGPLGLRERLLQQGIAIRGCGNYNGLDDGWYRIAVRPHEENEALITAIRQFCKEKSLWL